MRTDGPDALDPKTVLNGFCQRFCRRPITKDDVVYTVNKFGLDGHQAIVKLDCIEGREFAGELKPDAKLAQKSAAEQALLALAGEIAALPAAAAKGKKKPCHLARAGEAANDQDAEGVAGGHDGAELNNKTRLNTLCMKIIKRCLTKGDIVYESVQLLDGHHSAVRLPCLPGEWAGQMWKGQISARLKDSEQNAAGLVLEALLADPDICAVASAGRGAVGRGPGPGGKGWGLGPGPSGPDLAREVLADAPMTGQVVEWRHTFGWIQPDVSVDHPLAPKHVGRIYVHQKDLGGRPELERDARVRFVLYADDCGLGAQDVEVLD